MLNLPILRWGQPYTRPVARKDSVVHFITGETLAKVSQAKHLDCLSRDMRMAHRARGEVPDRDSRSRS